MKRIYWRPSRVSWTALSVAAALSLAGLGAVELFRPRPEESTQRQMLEASRLARDAFRVVQQERTRRGFEIDPGTDPTGSGLIGVSMSPTTSNSGDLPAKQTSVNPNFAAVLVRMMKKAGVEEGDVVAGGFSGSFPALNIAALSAAQALDVEIVPISSVAASQWGANDPRMLWVDMERALQRRGVFETRSAAASLGGLEDRALGMEPRGRRLLRRAIERNDLEMIDVKDYAESVSKRMRIYEAKASEESIAAYVNIGGSTVSVGSRHAKYSFRPGVNYESPPGVTGIDSVMARFIEDGVPVIHLVNIDRIALAYGLPQQPAEPQRPGRGAVYDQSRANPWLVGAVLLGILAGCFFLLRSPWGALALWSAGNRKEPLEPRV